MSKKYLMDLVDSMSLKKNVGQLFILAFPGKNPDKIIPLIKEYGVGGCYISQDNAETFKEAKALTQSIQSSSEIPMILGVDQEGAWGVLVPESSTGPGNLALGAGDNLKTTQKMYTIFAEEMGSVGYNTVLGPCADVNLKPDNPIIDTRSFGENPISVGKHVSHAVKGLNSGNVISTAKHFPGHGDTSADTHREIPVVNKSLEELKINDLLPFKDAIDSGVDIIMTSHIKYPKIDKDNPATFSETILKKILREELGFNGLILSDSLNMGAIRNYYTPEESALLAIKAGVELIMLSEEHYDHDTDYLNKQINTMSEVVKAVESGDISEKKITEIVKKIIEFKYDKGLFNNYDYRSGLNKKEVEEEASSSAITILKDLNHLWPIDLEKKIIVINTTPKNANTKVMNPRGIGPNQATSAYTTLKSELKKHSNEIEFEDFENIELESSKYKNYSYIILVSEDYPLAGEDYNIPKSEEIIKYFINKHQDNVLLFGLRSPYQLMNYPELKFYMTSYSSSTCSAEAITKMLIKGEQPKGKRILTLT